MPMTRPTGILGAIGTVFLAAALLALMLWFVGQPNLVSWWRAEYLIAGFIVMLIGAVGLARRSQKAATSTAQGARGALASLVKGIGVVLGALLLVLLFALIAH
jgi:hypothetical protein